jgi:hypothetical protein
MTKFFKFTIIWISQNLAIPFWTIGHIHLMTTLYENFIEIIASLGMNIIVFIGFWLNWLENYETNKTFKNGKQNN